jgi:hypothetical protein
MGGPGASVLVREALTRQQEDELEVWLRSITNHLEKGKWAYEFWLNEDAFPGTVSRCLFYLSVEETKECWDEDEKRQVKDLLDYLPKQSIDVSSGCNQDEDHATLGQFVLHLAKVYDGLIDMGGAITPPLKPLGEENLKKLRTMLATAPERAQERQAHIQSRLSALSATLPPGRTIQDLVKEQRSDPHSPVKTIMDDAEAKFGSTLPPELRPSARRPSLEEISAHVRAMPGTIYEFEYTTAAGHRWVSHMVDVPFFQAWMEHPNFHMIK